MVPQRFMLISLMHPEKQNYTPLKSLNIEKNPVFP